jgi:DNA adenine methylase
MCPMSELRMVPLFEEAQGCRATPLTAQLLKWIGNKQRSSEEIIRFFPARFGTYYEPFLGSGAVLATLAPTLAVGSDVFRPLIEIFQTLQSDPEALKAWYSARWESFRSGDRAAAYRTIRDAYNASPNPADLLFISRSCYGGVIRFRKIDRGISTPLGPHDPISPDAFAHRVDAWHERVSGTVFRCCDYSEVLAGASEGDLVYCDPPYSHSQAILYGAPARDPRMQRARGIRRTEH